MNLSILYMVLAPVQQVLHYLWTNNSSTADQHCIYYHSHTRFNHFSFLLLNFNWRHQYCHHSAAWTAAFHSTYLPLFLDMPPEIQRLLMKRKTVTVFSYCVAWAWRAAWRTDRHMYSTLLATTWERPLLRRTGSTVRKKKTAHRLTTPRANGLAWGNNFLYWDYTTMEVTSCNTQCTKAPLSYPCFNSWYQVPH